MTAGAAVLVNSAMAKQVTDAIPGGAMGKVAVGVGVVYAGTKVDGIAGAALIGAGAGLAFDGLLSLAGL